MNLPLNIDIQQILLHMLNFVILFGGLYFILYSPVKKFMDARNAKYKEDDEKAASALKEAEEAKEEYQRKLADGEREVAEIKAEAADKARAFADEAKKKAEAEAAEIISAARKRAEAEKTEIIASARQDISVLAAAAAEKIVYKNSSEAFDDFLAGAESAKDESTSAGVKVTADGKEIYDDTSKAFDGFSSGR